MSHIVNLGDCLEGMATLGDASVDHVVCDPPFTQRTSENARGHKNTTLGNYTGDANRRRIGFDGIDGLEATLVREFLRVSNRWCVVFCAIEQVGAYAAAAGREWVRGTVWHRTNSAPQFTGDRPGQAVEAIAIFHRKGRKRWNRGGTSLAYTGPTINSCGDPDRGIDHPTPKPTWIMESILRDFTDPGDLILDPFAGSGTTGVACKRLGRRFVGWEMNEKYQAAAQRRIDGTHEQLELVRHRGPKARQLMLGAGE